VFSLSFSSIVLFSFILLSIPHIHLHSALQHSLQPAA
jgi:hypothetical protein